MPFRTKSLTTGFSTSSTRGVSVVVVKTRGMEEFSGVRLSDSASRLKILPVATDTSVSTSLIKMSPSVGAGLTVSCP